MLRTLLLTSLLLGSADAERPNILLICVDDLRPELKSFGAAHIHSPAMDSLASSGRAFHSHYVQAPTCGASRYVLLTGRYGATRRLRDNDALFRHAPNAAKEPLSLPQQFRKNGYRTVSIGKISHHPGGLGGPEWNDPGVPEMPDAWDVHLMPTGPWETPRKAMHGYANGKPRKPGSTPANEHLAGDDMTYTDGWITREALGQMESLASNKQPFLLAVGIMKPHLPFACPKSYLDLYQGVKLPPIPHPEKPQGLSTWHASGECLKTYTHAGRDPRKDAAYADELRLSYAACVSYADAQIAKLLKRLDELKLTNETIVVLWGDHGWHLGEHAIWGKHSLFEESLRSPLIIRIPGMKDAGKKCDAIVETADIYPTLCQLAGVPLPDGLSGTSLVPRLNDPSGGGGTAVSYSPTKETLRTSTHRLIRHRGDPPAFELYDHRSDPGETRNIAADHPDVVRELNQQLTQRLK